MSTPESITDGERAFAENVKRLREERGWSQGALASLMADRGIAYASQSTISRIEKGARPVRLGEAEALSRIFQLPTYMMSRTTSKYLDMLEALEKGAQDAHGARAEFRKQARTVLLHVKNAKSNQDALASLIAAWSEDEGTPPPDAENRVHVLSENIHRIASLDVRQDLERAIEEFDLEAKRGNRNEEG